MPRLPQNTRFEIGTNDHKYTAFVPIDGKIKRVSFGHKKYEQYKDSVPSNMGGGKWSKKNHLDKKRRSTYRARAEGQMLKDGRRAIDVRYTPAWFSYHYLW